MDDNYKVLLVEDNEQNAYLARFLLEKAGMHVTHAWNGTEALALARTARHDIILLDIQLPDVDGYRLALKFQNDPATQGVPIVAVTSFAMPQEREKAFGAGCIGYIEKPISALDFVEQVRSYIRSHEDSRSR